MPDHPVELPLRLHKSAGLPAWQMAIGLGVALLCGMGEILGWGPLFARLPAFAPQLFVFAVVGVLYLMLRNPCELIVDAPGVTYGSRRIRFFIAWRDIERITVLEKTVRLDLKGRSEDEGVQIPGSLLKGPTRLAEALRAGLALWGGSSAPAAPSVLPARAAKPKRGLVPATPRDRTGHLGAPSPATGALTGAGPGSSRRHG